jgi:type I restriction enzyme, S subunit
VERWRVLKLGDVIEVKHGFAFKSEHFTDKGDYVLLTPGNFQEQGGLKLKGEKEKFYVGDFPADYLLRKGDLLLAMTDLTQNAPILGSPAFVPESDRFLHNQRLGKVVNLRPDQIDLDFLFYLFNTSSVRGQIKGSASGATVRHTSPSRIYDVAVTVPPLNVQRQIAGILANYDRLIENQKRRIQILEDMARALYREWFVEFRFPGQGSAKRSSVNVPKGWALVPLPECIEINPRVSVEKGAELPFVSMAGLANNCMLITEIESRAASGGSKFQNGDTLFARITPCLENGKTGFVQFLPTSEAAAMGSTEFIVLRSCSLTPEFVYCLARSEEIRNVAIKSMTGASGRQRVQEKCFDTIQIPHPPHELLNRFRAIVAPSFELIHNLFEQSQRLRGARNLLLPRLFATKPLRITREIRGLPS